MTHEIATTFKMYLEKMAPELEKLLPEGVSIDRFKRVALTAIGQDPQLMACHPMELFAELSKCAQDGLLPDKRDAAMILYKGRPKYVPMVGGILRRLRNSRELKDLSVQVIHRNDEFQYWVDENGPHVLFKPKIFEERGEKMGVFCVATMTNGGTFVEIMTRAELQKIKNLSKAKSGPWFDWEDEMEKKSVIRRISKYLPLSAELQATLAREDEELNESEPENTIEIKSVKDLEEKEQCENKEAPSTSSPSTEATASSAEPKNTPPSEKSDAPKKNDNGRSGFTRAQLGKEILKLSKDLDWSAEKLADWIKNNFGKGSKELSDEEVLEVANTLAEFAYGKVES